VLLLLAVVACGGREIEGTPLTAASTSPTGSPGGTGTSATVPGCAAGDISASGGPFCYPLPHGFRDFSAQDDYGYGWQWRTLVSAGPHDLIEVLAHPAQTDLRTLDDAAARRFAEQLRLRPEGVHIVSASELMPTTVAGKRAFRQDATYSGGIGVRTWAILAGDATVYVSCQASAPGRGKVTAACDDLIRTLKIS
jgi:hypothetical protein